jgi:2'-5' RNA ligase
LPFTKFNPVKPSFKRENQSVFEFGGNKYDRTVRLFIAIFLPESALSDVNAFSRQFSSPRLRWVPPASLHITLKFLGETQEAHLPKLETELTRASLSCPRFEIGVKGGGVFPNGRRPRIFWAGLSGETRRLCELARQTGSICSDFGVPSDEKEFAPHLTLARCRSDARCLPDDARSFMTAAAALEVPPFSVAAMHLVRSHLSGSGSRYETLRSFPLAA